MVNRSYPDDLEHDFLDTVMYADQKYTVTGIKWSYKVRNWVYVLEHEKYAGSYEAILHDHVYSIEEYKEKRVEELERKLEEVKNLK